MAEKVSITIDAGKYGRLLEALTENERLKTDNERLRSALLGAGKERDAVFQTEIERLRAALKFYADPETYHAIGFFPDPPCGGFVEDFDEEHGHEFYNRPMPGKRARKALEE
jgi:hypothetical protein